MQDYKNAFKIIPSSRNFAEGNVKRLLHLIVPPRWLESRTKGSEISKTENGMVKWKSGQKIQNHLAVSTLADVNN